MKYKKRTWIILVIILIVVAVIIRDYNDEINKVDERVILGIAECTFEIENIRINETYYELKDKMKRAETLSSLIPIKEKSQKEVEYILVAKSLNELMYDISYARKNGDEEGVLEANEAYKESFMEIKEILLPYREKYSEVQILWSEGIFLE